MNKNIYICVSETEITGETTKRELFTQDARKAVEFIQKEIPEQNEEETKGQPIPF